jgi:hypothetical protein
MPPDVAVGEPFPGCRYIPKVTPKSTTSLLFPLRSLCRPSIPPVSAAVAQGA